MESRGRRNRGKRNPYQQTWGAYHRNEKKAKLAKEMEHKESIEKFQKLKDVNTLCTAFLVFRTNPQNARIGKLRESGHEISLNSEEMERKLNKERLDINDFDPEFATCIEKINQFADWMVSTKSCVSYSRKCGFGIYVPSEIPLVDFDYPVMEELTDLESEVEEWGRGFDDNGRIFWTFGMSALMNHACPDHATAKCDFNILKSEDNAGDIIRFELARNTTNPILTKDPILTWTYRRDNDLSFSCMKCDLVNESNLLKKTVRAFRLLEPLYSTYTYMPPESAEFLKLIPQSYRAQLDVPYPESPVGAESIKVYLQANNIVKLDYAQACELLNTLEYKNLELGILIGILLHPLE